MLRLFSTMVELTLCVDAAEAAVAAAVVGVIVRRLVAAAYFFCTDFRDDVREKFSIVCPRWRVVLAVRCFFVG